MKKSTIAGGIIMITLGASIGLLNKIISPGEPWVSTQTLDIIMVVCGAGVILCSALLYFLRGKTNVGD